MLLQSLLVSVAGNLLVILFLKWLTSYTSLFFSKRVLPFHHFHYSSLQPRRCVLRTPFLIQKTSQTFSLHSLWHQSIPRALGSVKQHTVTEWLVTFCSGTKGMLRSISCRYLQWRSMHFLILGYICFPSFCLCFTCMTLPSNASSDWCSALSHSWYESAPWLGWHCWKYRGPSADLPCVTCPRA